jgi:hypothetical protein
MVEVGTWSLHVKSAPRKKNPIKNSTVIDRESDSLSITVDFFFYCGFFFLVHFYMQAHVSEFNQGHSSSIRILLYR